MWAYNSVFYQIYPLGFCGAPFENDGQLTSRILKIEEWIPHMQKMGVDAIYLCPVFESDTHGYNTRDYVMVDRRLGSNEDLAHVTKALHEAGIKVVFDGVFNHVGRGFWAFQDVLKNREQSPYINWFHRIDFGGNSPYNDGLWYEGWEGNYDLVKLNLHNEDVVQHIFWAVSEWIRQFDIDGIRLDVAYCLDRNFTRRLREFCDSQKTDFFLLGEVLHGEYGRMIQEMGIHSVTNYQCYKGLYSAFNSANMFEIVHSLARLFGPEDWTVCRGAHLLSFCDNHDVSRIASALQNPKHLPLVYGMMFGMPGIPCIYYGSEWGTKADKSQGDPALRVSFEKPEWNELTDYIQDLIKIRKQTTALAYGGFRSLAINNKACIMERRSEKECILVCINMSDGPEDLYPNTGYQEAQDLLSGEKRILDHKITLAPLSVEFWRL